MRPSFETIYMNLAVQMASRSTCKRTNKTGDLMQVGCAIVTPDFRKVLAVGYNGNASGLANECDSAEVGNCGCIHAEANAVVNCDAPRETKKIVLVTHLPCVACGKLLINLGNVQEVIYLSDYRNRASLENFDKVGIRYRQFMLGET
jgi:dCMP deaminase